MKILFILLIYLMGVTAYAQLTTTNKIPGAFDKFEPNSRKALHCKVVSSSVKGVVVVDKNQITYEVRNKFLNGLSFKSDEIEAANAVIVNKCGNNKLIIYHDNKGLVDGADVEFYYNGNRFNPKDPKYRAEIEREVEEIQADRQWAKGAAKRELIATYDKAIEDAEKVKLAILEERKGTPISTPKAPDFNGFLGVEFGLDENGVTMLFLNAEPPLKPRQRIGRKKSLNFALVFEGFPSIKNACVSTLVFTNKKLSEIQLVLEDTPDYSSFNTYEKAFRESWTVISPSDNRKTALKKGQPPYFNASNDLCQARVEIKQIQGGPVELHITIKPCATTDALPDGIKL